ncbi:putative AC transposase, partial [Bienertia sinuspersici]
YGLRKKVIALDTPTRWNSTYKLLYDAIAYRDVLTDMYNESRVTDGQFITNDHWSLAKIVHDVLETFDNATHIFSYVYEPNIHMVILECIKIICTIKQTSLANLSAAVKRLLDNMKVSNSKRILERLCEDYGAVIQPQPVGSSMGASRFGILGPLLHDAIAYCDVLTDMYNESRATDGQFITNDHWSLAKIVHDVLETFDNATHIFSYVYEPNIHMVILECIKIICTIKQTSLANPSAAVKRLLDNM